MAKRPQQMAPEAANVPRSGKATKVIVGSKLPMHVELQLCTSTEARVTGQFGSVTETVYIKTGTRYVIRGIGHPVGALPRGYPGAPNVNQSGYAKTPGIPKDFWDAWLQQNCDTDMVRNKLIVAEEDPDSFDDLSADFGDVDSGLGPLVPTEQDSSGRVTQSDPRNPKPLTSAVSPVVQGAVE